MKKNFNLKIYADSYERFAEWQGPDYTPLNLTFDLNECLAQPCKVLIVNAFCDNPEQVYSYNPMFANFNWEEIDLVVIKEVLWESYEHILKEFILKNKIKRYVISSHNRDCNKNLFVPYWFLRPTNYSDIQDITDSPRKYLFDALLGYPRLHRFFVLAKLLQNKKILEKSVVTFRKEFLFDGEDIDSIWRNIDPKIREMFDNNLVYPYVSPTMDESWENVAGDDFNRRYLLNGTDIPWKVYENTWYSICTETNDRNSFSKDEIPRITEKTARLFLAKRVFVMFGCRGNLRLLKDLGFKTFDSIINESYDNEPDPISRFEKAFVEVEKLAELDPIEVYNDTKEIREHNFQRMFGLRDELRNKANELLISMIPEEFCS